MPCANHEDVSGLLPQCMHWSWNVETGHLWIYLTATFGHNVCLQNVPYNRGPFIPNICTYMHIYDETRDHPDKSNKGRHHVFYLTCAIKKKLKTKSKALPGLENADKNFINST